MKYILSLALACFSTTSFAGVKPMTELTDANFDDTIRKSAIAVVDFNRKSCGFCQRYEGVLLDFAGANPNVDVYSVDKDYEPYLSADFNIRVTPTTYIYRNGKIVASFEGAVNENYLVNVINSHK